MIYRKTKLIVIPKKAGSLWQKSCEFHSKLSVYVVLSCHSQMVNTNTLVRSTFNCYIKKKNVSSIHAVSPPTLAPQFSNLKSVKMHSNGMYCWPPANYHAIISVLPPWASGLQLYCGCLRAWALTCVRYTADKVCVLMSRRWKCKFCDLGNFHYILCLWGHACNALSVYCMSMWIIQQCPPVCFWRILHKSASFPVSAMRRVRHLWPSKQYQQWQNGCLNDRLAPKVSHCLSC